LLLSPQQRATPLPPRLLRATDLEQELAACAAWCRAHVERNPGARLLVTSACIEPSLAIQAAMLWRSLAGESGGLAAGQGRWRPVGGGGPLLRQALAGEALATLERAAGAEVDAAVLQALLRSPYFGVTPDGPRLSLAAWLGEQGLRHWPRTALLDALRSAAAHEPAAGELAAWLTGTAGTLAETGRLGATEWARRFTGLLDAAAFARAAPLDSREQQRLARWNELLDVFAGLDAVLPPLSLQAALARLRRLAVQARHQAASADTAITLTANLADPVVAPDRKSTRLN